MFKLNNMKIGSEVWVHCNEMVFGDKIVVLIIGTLVGETESCITIKGGNKIFVIKLSDVIYMQRSVEDDLEF